MRCMSRSVGRHVAHSNRGRCTGQVVRRVDSDHRTHRARRTEGGGGGTVVKAWKKKTSNKIIFIWSWQICAKRNLSRTGQNTQSVSNSSFDQSSSCYNMPLYAKGFFSFIKVVSLASREDSLSITWFMMTFLTTFFFLVRFFGWLHPILDCISWNLPNS